MRILYLSLSYVPSRRASSVQVMRMCAALARAGHEVRLLSKRSAEPAPRGPHAFYGVPESFALTQLPRPRRRGGGVVFSAAVAAEVLRSARRTDLVVSRDLIGAVIADSVRLPVLFEAHSIPASPVLLRLWRHLAASPRLRRLVVISEALRRDVVAAGLAPRHGSVVVAHDAADPPVDPPALLAQHRARGGPVQVGYVGSLYPGRGVELILELARRLPHLRFELVGGAEADLARWRPALPGNATLRGFVPPAELAARYAELDILLMPYARSGVGGPLAATDTSRWCSPMKMFEYMASGAPIVSSDLPVLQEVLLHEHNALIAPVDDPSAWQRAVERLAGDADTRHWLAGNAMRDVCRLYTWDARVAKVLAGL